MTNVGTSHRLATPMATNNVAGDIETTRSDGEVALGNVYKAQFVCVPMLL